MREPKEAKEPQLPACTLLVGADFVAECVIPDSGVPCFAVLNRSSGSVSYLSTVVLAGIEYRPLPDDSLIGFVKFPSKASEYGTDSALFSDLRAFIRRWCELEPRYEMLAALYCMYTWAHDEFLEVPYLRILADLGSGKSRLGVQVLGSVCYKPFATIAASTLSPLFRTLDFLGGTMVLDEADLDADSDKSSELVQMLNCGYMKGLDMLRSEVGGKGRGGFRTARYRVFGPKIIISRENFRDDALESRCLPIRLTAAVGKVPLLVDESLAAEASGLRDMLLMWRFRGWGTRRAAVDWSFGDLDLPPRLRQLLLLVSGILVDPAMKDVLRSLGTEFSRQHAEARSETNEGEMALILCSYPAGSSVSCGEVADRFNADKTDSKDRKNAKSVGWYFRQRLGLVTGVSGRGRRRCVTLSEAERASLMSRFGFAEGDLLKGLVPEGDAGDPMF